MIQRIRRSDVLHHGALVFGGVLVANVFNYLFYMLIGRRAGVVVYGEVTSLASALLVLGAPANVVQLIAARLAADLGARKDEAGLRALSNAIAVWTSAVGVVLIAAVLLARVPIAHFLNIADTTPIILTAISVGLYWVAYAQRGVLQGAHHFGDYSFSIALEALGKVIVGVALVSFFAASGALAGIAIALALAVAYNLVRCRLLFGPITSGIAFDRRTLFRVVAGVGLGQATITVLTFYDVPLVKHAFDARTAGLYAAAALVGRAVIGAAYFVPTIVLPKAYARAAAGRSALPLLGAALGLAAVFALVAIAFGAVAPRLVVTLVAGRAFGDAAPLVLLYAMASGALSLATVVAAYNFGLHRYDFVVPTFVVACVEVVTLALWHPSPIAVVTVLAVGHSCVLAATLFRVGAAVTKPLPAEFDPERFPSPEPVG